MISTLFLSKLEVEELKSILVSNLSEEDVIIFGSRVSGRMHEHSDLDIAIKGEGKLTFELISNLRESFESASFSFRVDLLDYHRISREFQEVIDRTGVRFDYECLTHEDESCQIESY